MNCEHILVDGWNVIHAEPKLKKLLAGSASAAQKALAEILEPIHDMYATRITIVYDGNGSDVSIVRPNDAVSSFVEVYTPSSMTADEFIERYCALARNKSNIVVISNDNMIWETVSVLGAVCMRIGEIFAYGKVATEDIKRFTSNLNFNTARQWQNSGALAQLDNLELEINCMKSSLFSSKKMQKRLKKITQDSNCTPATPKKDKHIELAKDVATLKVHKPYKPKKTVQSVGEAPKKRIPHIFKDFKELGRSPKKKK